MFTASALFEKDKFIFKVLVTFKILQHGGSIDRAELDFLLKCPVVREAENPCQDFLTDAQWGALKVNWSLLFSIMSKANVIVRIEIPSNNCESLVYHDSHSFVQENPTQKIQWKYQCIINYLSKCSLARYTKRILSHAITAII